MNHGVKCGNNRFWLQFFFLRIDVPLTAHKFVMLYYPHQPAIVLLVVSTIKLEGS
jgi:hypothetical protein